MHLRSTCLTIATLVIGACQNTVNITDTNVDTDTVSTNTDGGATTNGPLTTGKATDDAPSSGGPDSSTTNDADTTNNPDTTGDPTNPIDTTSGSDTNTTSTTATSGETSASETTASDSTTDGSTTLDTDGPAGNCPVGWTRARNIAINNEPEKPLTDFQTFLTIPWDDDMLVDFSDLRFTDEKGTLLPHWLEDYTAPIKATIWVKVPAIAAAGITNITMCYGNPDAPSSSDGFATFIFFDDFEIDKLDANKWLSTVPNTVSNGVLNLTKGSVYTKGSPGKFPNLYIEAKIKGGAPWLAINGAQIGTVPRIWVSPAGYSTYGFNMNNDAVKLAEGTWKAPCCGDPNGDIFGAAADEANFYMFANRMEGITAKAIWKAPIFIGFGDPQMKNADNVTQYNSQILWTLVRKFTSVEPTSEIGPEQNI